VENLTSFERLQCIYRYCINATPKKGEIVKYLVNGFNIPRSTASNWQKHNKIDNDEVLIEIVKSLHLDVRIWSENDYVDIINFTNHVKDYRLIVKDIEIKKTLDTIVYGDSFDYPENSPQRLHENAKQFKKEEKIDEALEAIEALLRHHSYYVYTHYNEILHLKAILLSHNHKKAFDEAIHILQLLYSAMEYHLKEPEILSLLGSNYKRKAFYDETGELRTKDDINKDYLKLSLQNYGQALQIRCNERYYDAINIAYIRKILFGIDNNDIDKLRKSEPNWIPNGSSWWEKATSAEFFVLCGDLDNAKREIDEFFEKETADPHDISATLRQIQLYLQAKPEDQMVKDFYVYLNESLEYMNGRI